MLGSHPARFRMYIYIHMCVCVYACVRVCKQWFFCTLNIFFYLALHMCICMYVCIYIYIYINTYIHSVKFLCIYINRMEVWGPSAPIGRQGRK